MSQSRTPGTPSLLRAINDRAALELLLDRGPLTRAELGELTGLSKVTASQLLARLDTPEWPVATTVDMSQKRYFKFPTPADVAQLRAKGKRML